MSKHVGGVGKRRSRTCSLSLPLALARGIMVSGAKTEIPRQRAPHHAHKPAARASIRVFVLPREQALARGCVARGIRSAGVISPAPPNTNLRHLYPSLASPPVPVIAPGHG